MKNISENPFAVHNPESVDNISPQRLVELFVEENTNLPSVERQKHTFVWGPRGSGKSFLFQYLEPKCQFIKHGSPEEFFNSTTPYVGVYIPIKEGKINKSELDILDEQSSRIITEHLLNLDISECVISTLRDQFPEKYISDEDKLEYTENFVGFFDSGSIAPSKQSASEAVVMEDSPFDWLVELIKEEKQRINRYIKDCHFNEIRYEATTSGYHDFLLPMLESVQTLIGHDDVPVYLLLDDVFFLWESQQKIVNTWIANRDQNTVCIKASSIFDRYDTFQTVGRGRIERAHDYTEVNMDELYTQDPRKYIDKVRTIANKRLEIAGLPTRDIEELLPSSEREQEILQEIRRSNGEGMGDPKSDKNSIPAKARLFQRLAEMNNEKSYAGFENIVHISSGIVRFFLEPCSLMFDEYLDRGQNPSEIEELSPELQDNVLKSYSERFFSEESRKYAKDLDSEETSDLDKLMTLVQSLGRLFYTRLHDSDSSEPRVLAFSVNGEISDSSDLGDILQLGRQVQFFHYTTYATKDGGGRNDCYVLDRRLAPIFKIDPTAPKRRIPLSPEELEIGCKSPEEFLRRVIGKDEYQEHLNVYSGSNK